MLNTFKKSQDLYKNKPWLTFLVLVTFGTMVLAVCSLLPGCGSDSTPGGSVKGKNAKTVAKSNPTKTQGTSKLLLDEETKTIDNATIKHHPEYQRLETSLGVTLEELDARIEADRKLSVDPDAEVFPGMTRGELYARAEADRKLSEDPDIEVFPGITRRELHARQAEHLRSFDPKTEEVVPGVTRAQVEARNSK